MTQATTTTIRPGAASRPAWRPEPEIRPQLLLYTALALLPVALALPRLVTGPWYHTHTPPGVRLLEGWPIAWESTYYLMHFPTFLADAPPDGAPFTSVQYRTLPNLYLATALFALTGSVFWSMALVDWLFWFLGGVAGYQVALRLGARPAAAALGALMLVAAPLFACSIWRVDLRLGNSASMALGLWAALALVDERRTPWRLSAGLGFLLFLLSLSYQYQWILAPMLGVLALASPRLTRRQAAGVLAGSILVYAAGTVAFKALLAAGVPGPPPAESSGIVAGAEELAAARLARVRSPGDLLALLPSWYHVRLMAAAYHPAVFVAGLAGLCLLPARARWLTLAAVAATLLATSLYPYPWLAMSAYPLIYAGAGVSCAAAGAVAARAAGHVARRLRPRDLRDPAAGYAWDARLAGAVSLALAFVFASLTNLDLAGNPQFLLQWWDYWERITF